MGPQDRSPRTDHRLTIIRGQTLRDDQLDKMAALGVSVSFFSYHIYVWGDRHRELFLGPERAMRISPAVNRLTAGGHVPRLRTTHYPHPGPPRPHHRRRLASFSEDDLGSIEPRKSAGFAVLSKNPLENAETIKGIEVLATVKDGEVIFGSV